MSSTTVPNPANGSFPSRSCRLSAGWALEIYTENRALSTRPGRQIDKNKTEFWVSEIDPWCDLSLWAKWKHYWCWCFESFPMVTIKVVTLTPTFALVWQEKALGLFLFANFFENKTVWVTFLLHIMCDACRTCMLILTMIVMVKALNGVHVRHWWGHYDVKNKLQCSVRWEEGGRAGSEEHIYSGNDWSCVLGIFYNRCTRYNWCLLSHIFIRKKFQKFIVFFCVWVCAGVSKVQKGDAQYLDKLILSSTNMS